MVRISVSDQSGCALSICELVNTFPFHTEFNQRFCAASCTSIVMKQTKLEMPGAFLMKLRKKGTKQLSDFHNWPHFSEF